VGEIKEGANSFKNPLKNQLKVLFLIKDFNP
jgi:hypothetical protein